VIDSVHKIFNYKIHVIETDVDKYGYYTKIMKIIISTLSLVLLVLFTATGGALVATFSTVGTSSNQQFSIEAPAVYGVNEYTLIEVDEGDNDEEEVIFAKLHEFIFESQNSNGIVVWDFGDGNSATGQEVSHTYDDPGYYTVTATSTSSKKVELSTLEVTVEMIGYVESDNMECACAPTAKSTIVDLIPPQGLLSFEGIVTVEHDGSSESCTLRNPLQECHLRVIIEYTKDGAIINQNIIFDGTFRTNEKNVQFEISDLNVEEGEGLQIRLETDQLRDWHKPSTTWSMTAPIQ
jgi:PKD repeat protein